MPSGIDYKFGNIVQQSIFEKCSKLYESAILRQLKNERWAWSICISFIHIFWAIKIYKMVICKNFHGDSLISNGVFRITINICIFFLQSYCKILKIAKSTMLVESNFSN